MQEQLSFLDTPKRGEFPLEGAKAGTCRSCGAAIAWATTAHGAAIPLDLARVTDYNGQRYAVTHFAHCPEGREWSRKK